MNLVSDHEQSTVDPDLPGSWPQALCDLIQRIDTQTVSNQYVTDLAVPDQADVEIRYVLSGVRVKAFHATRLLPHEGEGIRANGLRVFGRELFDDRIEGAFGQGHITKPEREALHSAHMFAVGEENDRGRRPEVCLTLRQASFENGIEPLLSNWGGEGIYFSSGALTLTPLLQRLGRPAIVVCVAQIKPTHEEQPINPDLGKTLLGAWRGLQDGAEVFHPDPIPPCDILDIWWPGDAQYDAHPTLPQA